MRACPSECCTAMLHNVAVGINCLRLLLLSAPYKNHKRWKEREKYGRVITFFDTSCECMTARSAIEV